MHVEKRSLPLHTNRIVLITYNVIKRPTLKPDTINLGESSAKVQYTVNNKKLLVYGSEVLENYFCYSAEGF